MATESTHSYAARVTAELYRAVIGPQGQDHYLRQFQRFDADGRTHIGWHGLAFWATLNWLLYRRMWGRALAYAAALLGSMLLIFAAGRMVFDYSLARASLLALLPLPLAFVLPALYADAWYYRHCRRKIEAAQRVSDRVDEVRALLARHAPGARSLLGQLLVNVALVALAAYQGQLWLSASRNPGEAEVSRAPVVAPAAPPPTRAAPAAPAPPVAAPAVVVPPVVASAASSAATAPPSPTVPAAPAPAASAVSAVAAASPAPAALSAPAPASRKVHTAPHVWVVQVGAYAQEAHARQALARVQAMGLEAGMVVSDTPRGRLIRVRVGPYTQRAEALRAAQRIRAAQLPAQVLRQRP